MLKIHSLIKLITCKRDKQEKKAEREWKKRENELKNKLKPCAGHVKNSEEYSGKLHCVCECLRTPCTFIDWSISIEFDYVTFLMQVPMNAVAFVSVVVVLTVCFVCHRVQRKSVLTKCLCWFPAWQLEAHICISSIRNWYNQHVGGSVQYWFLWLHPHASPWYLSPV